MLVSLDLGVAFDMVYTVSCFSFANFDKMKVLVSVLLSVVAKKNDGP